MRRLLKEARTIGVFRALIGHNLFFLGKLSMAYDANGEEQPGQSSNRNVV